MLDVTTTSPTTRRILKALSIFGGVQVLQILCSVVRTKLVALWMGPMGVGLIAIYASTMDFVSQTSQLNLRQSAVRDLSMCKDHPVRLADTVAVVRRIAIALGLAGMLLVAAASPLLGWFSFGDSHHWLPFLLLSPLLFLASAATGEWAVMQGRDQFKRLANSTLYASVASTAIALPIFYFFRIEGIVPVLVLFQLCNCLFALYFGGRDLPRVRIGLREAWRKGRGMLSLGMYMTVSSAVTLLASYVFIVYLNRCHSQETVGFYQAGYTIVNSYVGLIFTSIAMEYFPRLSAISSHRVRTEVIVSHEIKIALWVLLPVIICFVCAKGLIVDILYSGSFDAVVPYIGIAITGVAMRAVSWCMAFTMLARADGRIYVLTELGSALVYLALNIPLYEAYGFAGLGVAYVLWYSIYTAICYAVYRYRYGLRLRPGIAGLMALITCAGFAAYGLDALAGPWWTAIIMLPPASYAAFKAVTNRRKLHHRP